MRSLFVILRSMGLLLNRTWLVSSTTYGTWLPGDRRSFVGPVDGDLGYEIHNIPGTPCDGPNERLAKWSYSQLKGAPIYLDRAQAEAILGQFRETCCYRQWRLLCASVMANHFHAVLTVPGDPPAEKLLGDLKGYGSRALNRIWGKPESGTWWTESGSRRRKQTERQILSAVRYVWNQKSWLSRYVDPDVPIDWLQTTTRPSGERGP